MRRGLDLGANFIDTAELYGIEALVGEAIRGRRDVAFVATKLRTLRAPDVIASADASLRALGCDTIDLYQIHFPDAAVPIAETMGALSRLVEAGKVRHVGVSNFSVSELEKARRVFPYAIESKQILYNLIERTAEVDLLPYCQREGIAVIAYSPLAQGLAQIDARDPTGALRAVAREAGRTPGQVALRWCLHQRGVIVIPKAGTMAHVDENCEASGWSLTDEQVTRLTSRIVHTTRSRLYTTARRLVRQWTQRAGLRS